MIDIILQVLGLDIYPDSKVHGANRGPLGPVGLRWAPCWPQEPCYQGKESNWVITVLTDAPTRINRHSAGWDIKLP